jgi:Zn-dependent peptidase ImmA (M78 family)
MKIEDKKLPLIKCRTSDIESNGRNELSTDDDWMEWQADYMASTILMPQQAFSRVVKNKFQSAKIKEGCYQLGTDFEKDLWAEVMARELADLFDVSITAAKIRLKSLGFIKKQQDHQQHLF